MEHILLAPYKIINIININYSQEETTRRLLKKQLQKSYDKIKYKEKKRKWNLLMNCLPNDIEYSLSIREIAKKYCEKTWL